MNEAFNFKFTILGYSEQDRSMTVRYYTDAIYAGWKPLLEQKVAELAAGYPHMSIEETYRLAVDHQHLGIQLNLWLPDPVPTGDALIKFINEAAPIVALKRRHEQFTKPAPNLKHIEQHMQKEHAGSLAPQPAPAAAAPFDSNAVQLRPRRAKQIKTTVL